MAQPHNATADAVERLTPRLDKLAHDVRLGARCQADIDDFEARAQAIARDLVAAFRRPSRGFAPLAITDKGALW